jgi:hypothetical protein
MGVLPNKYKREFSDAKHKVTGLPWHHIKVAVISLLFVVALIMFAPIESPDESPVSHLTAVSHDTAYVPRPPIYIYCLFFFCSCFFPIFISAPDRGSSPKPSSRHH